MILVTGASGFVGSALVARLAREGHRVRACSRRDSGPLPPGVQRVRVADLGPQTDWTGPLEGVAAVVHAAAHVHVMDAAGADALDMFRRVNVAGSLALARAAAAAGVRRFVFISSVKVHGEATPAGRPFREEDPPAPSDAYGISKAEAEQALQALAAATGLELVIIRPPLVYGPGVKANFAALVRLVRCGWPLPLGAIDNRRSLVALDNLVDLILTCLHHPGAPGQVFLASDGQDLSTTALIRGLGAAIGRVPLLLPVPAVLLQVAAALVGKSAVAQRLCGNLQVDIARARQLLSWTPPVPVQEGLRRAVQQEADR
jgi:nucleoside-diphosphate-sugar epimerase